MAMFAIMVRLGLTPEEIRRRQMSFAVVRAETGFHRELRAGEVIALGSPCRKAWRVAATFQQATKQLRSAKIHGVHSIQNSRTPQIRDLPLLESVARHLSSTVLGIITLRCKRRSEGNDKEKARGRERLQSH
jgi:hypothetical protein